MKIVHKWLQHVFLIKNCSGLSKTEPTARWTREQHNCISAKCYISTWISIEGIPLFCHLNLNLYLCFVIWIWRHTFVILVLSFSFDLPLFVVIAQWAICWQISATNADIATPVSPQLLSRYQERQGTARTGAWRLSSIQPAFTWQYVWQLFNHCTAAQMQT